MTLEVKTTSKFKKDYKLIKKQNKNIGLLKEIVKKLSRCQILEEKYRDHELTGKYKGFRECHIQPDWLLVYLVDNGNLTLTLTRTGSHSDLF